jgi:hypothetical protein
MELMNPEQILFEELSALIEQSRREIISQANSGAVLMFWQIGKRINKNILQNKRADYGKQIVVTLSRQPRLWLFSSMNNSRLQGVFVIKAVRI